MLAAEECLVRCALHYSRPEFITDQTDLDYREICDTEGRRVKVGKGQTSESFFYRITKDHPLYKSFWTKSKYCFLELYLCYLSLLIRWDFMMPTMLSVLNIHVMSKF